MITTQSYLIRNTTTRPDGAKAKAGRRADVSRQL